MIELSWTDGFSAHSWDRIAAHTDGHERQVAGDDRLRSKE